MLTVRHNRHWYEPKLPHAVFVNGYYAGMVKDGDLRIEIPAAFMFTKLLFLPQQKNSNLMTELEAIKARHSVRQYIDMPIEAEKIEAIQGA